MDFIGAFLSFANKESTVRIAAEPRIFVEGPPKLSTVTAIGLGVGALALLGTLVMVVKR